MVRPLQYLQYTDQHLFLLLNRDLSWHFLDPFFTAITNGQFWIIPAIVGALVLLKTQGRRAWIAIGLAIVTVAISDPLANQILKPLFHRPRPCHPEFLIEGGRFLIGMKRSLGMPSSHAMNMFAQATLFAGLYPRFTVYFFFFAGLIGYSRIYVGVHYPGDVLAGACFGMAAGAGVYWVYRLIMRQDRRRDLQDQSRPKAAHHDRPIAGPDSEIQRG